MQKKMFFLFFFPKMVSMPCTLHFSKVTWPICSIINIFPSTSWWEQEVWDMFSVYFSNHLELCHILTYYSFEGHPLRKDFPWSEYVEVSYDDSKKCVVFEPIKMTQEFHYFDFANPWEQMSHSDKSNKK
jgi:NADH:ubiquinone oxidoreductase subunit C